MPSSRMWLRGRAVGKSLKSDLATADVVVVSRPHGFSGINYEAVRAVNEAVIYAEVTGAGEDSLLPPYEPVIAATTGRMQNLTGIIANAGPHFAAVPVACHATAQNLVSGILAVLYQRGRGGGGQKVSTSLVQWLQLGNLLPHLFASFMRVIGLEELLDGLPETTESVRDRILETMQTKSRDDWMALFVADGGVAAHPYLTAAETLADPDMTANGHVVKLDGVTQLGPVATLTRTPARVTMNAEPDGGPSWSSDSQSEAGQPAPVPTSSPPHPSVLPSLQI